jgi:hypothetical protein
LAIGVRDEIRPKSKEATFSSARLAAAFAEDTLVLRLQLTIGLHLIIDGVALWALLTK